MISGLSDWSEAAPMSLPRAGCSVGVIDSKLYVAGGTFWKDGVKYWSDHVDCFEPSTGRWKMQPPCPQPRGDAAAVVLGNALLLLGGGSDGPAERSVLVFADGKWTVDTALTLPAPRRSSGAVVFENTVYLLGGLSGKGTEFESATSNVYAARHGGGWRMCADMPGPPRFNAAVGVVGDQIIVAGGCTPVAGGVRNLDSVLAYHPSTDGWSDCTALPFAVRGACGLPLEGRLVIIGGYTDRFLSCIQSLDPVTGVSTLVGTLPCGLADTRFVRIGSQIWGVTGENGIKLRFAGTLKATVNL
jgi:N-acetylneuraminic acid mutarotase